MSVIGKLIYLSREGPGRIVYQGMFTVLKAQGLKECAGHVVKLDDGDLLTACHLAHGTGIVAMGLYDMTVFLVEGTTLGGGYEDYRGTF